MVCLGRPIAQQFCLGKFDPMCADDGVAQNPGWIETVVLEYPSLNAAVAQLDRVLGYEPRGRGFNSCQPHHSHNLLSSDGRFFFNFFP